ncbi:WXG100 family type VII secretion target [Yinghuangia seranimata]|uniref:WXG100 family type VII secretion target n=1 Tax=Yinghuangia seranimata TaxID=408067 RepID=UPI00248AA181|nr:WXG100 family type VII secretion target [Yinghuangia seranimata]MDI2125807.1 WXG100 family type VII secretion target [Yinghuangia seranimata]
MVVISLTYADMTRMADDLSDGRSQIADQLKILQAFVHTLVEGGYVTDESSKKFLTYYTEFDKGANQTIAALDDLGRFLKDAVENFRKLDKDLADGLRG